MMSRSRYGTFLESVDSEKTELRSLIAQRSHFEEMEHSVNQSYYPWVNCQESVVQNRLPLLWHEFLRWISNSGVASILICLHFSIIGLFALSLLSYERPSLWYNIAHYLFSCGTFGFTGGCVNYLAVTFFYKKIPGLYGTGIIVNHYQDICESVRTSVIDIFFDEEFLKFYSKQKLNHQIVRLNIEGHLQRILQSETVDQLITTELHSLASSPEGQLLSSVGIKLSSLRSLVKPYVVDLLTDVVPVLMERFTSYSQDQGIKNLKQELKSYTTRRKEEVPSNRVELLMKDLLFSHLQLLVILGCVVGIFLGVLSRISGVGQII